jgi:transglutaminase-like putative cysteine protease
MAAGAEVKFFAALERFRQAALWAMLACAAFALGAAWHIGWMTGAALLAAPLFYRAALLRYGRFPALPPWTATLLALASIVAWRLSSAGAAYDEAVHRLAILAWLLAALFTLVRPHRGARIVLGGAALLELAAAALSRPALAFPLCLLGFAVAAVAVFAASDLLRWSAPVAGLPLQWVADEQHGGRRRLRWSYTRAHVLLRTRAAGSALAAFVTLATLAIVVLTAAIFFVLPRTARAALARFGPVRTAAESSVDLTRTGELRPDRTPAFHVRFEGRRVPTGLYWRTGALGDFDGRRWTSGAAELDQVALRDALVQLVSDDQRRRRGARLTYEVALDERAEALPIAGLAENLRADLPALARDRGGALRVPFGAEPGLRYVVYAYLDPGAAAARLTDAERAPLLRLPAVDPRVRELVDRITRNARDDDERARALAAYLRSRYAYSLVGAESAAADPLAEFLFVRRAGHCEQFASALAVMLRAALVPSRVATGYLGGEENPLTHTLVVRDSDAHAWVEAWIRGRGWTPYDPTPAAALRPGADWRSRLELYVDSASSFWRQWIVGYDPDSQMTLAFRVDQARRQGAPWLERHWQRLLELSGRIEERGARRRGWVLLVLLGGAGAAALAWLWRLDRRGRARRRSAPRGHARLAHEATELYGGMLETLARWGIHRAGFQTPAEFARSVNRPELNAVLAEFTAGYYALRYAHDEASAPRLRALLRDLRALKPA